MSRLMPFLLILALWPAAAAAQSADVAAAPGLDPQDPFVRGLKRLDERMKMQQEAEELARRALELQKQAEEEAAAEAARRELGLEEGEGLADGEGLLIPPPLSDPDFFTAFAAQKYRLDGLVLSRPTSEPIIHIYEERIKPKANALYWSGRERRWVYERLMEEDLADIAEKLVMQVDDLLAMNGVMREEQLRDPDRFYVSPRDNGPLTHIIQRGDTLAKLAKAYDTDTARLRVRNKLEPKQPLVIGRRFLIREKAIDDRLAAMAVPQPMKQDTGNLAKARLPYARVGQFVSETEAMRGAREFYIKYYEFMDSDLVLRREQDAKQKNALFYNMDIGPLRSPRHAEAFCALFRTDDLPCLVVERVPGPERVRNFDSQAIISVTPYVYYDGDDKLDSGRTDVKSLTMLEYFLTEGQELGNAEGTIAKITADRIMLTDANGYLLTLPLNKVPEVDPIAKAEAEAAARQAALEQAAAAAGTAAGAAGGAAPDAPSVTDIPVAKGLAKSQEEDKKRKTAAEGAACDVIGLGC